MPEEIEINKLISGDLKSFRMLVEEHQKKVLNTCNRFVNNREDAEDLTQEVFMEVYRSVSNFRGDSKLSTWIYRIAVTKSLDYLRKKRRKKRFGILKNIFSEDTPSIQVKSPESLSPDKNLEQEDRVRILNESLDSLPENQRTAFTLSKYDEMSYAEIAEIMDTSVSSVESLIHRAKVNLKKRLTDFYEKKII